MAKRIMGLSWPAVQLPEGSAPLDVNFDAAVLGISQEFGRGSAIVDEPSMFSSWWFWTGAAVLAGAATTTAILLTRSSEPDPVADDRVEVNLSFP